MKLRNKENILIINLLIICAAMILSSFTDGIRRTYQQYVAEALNTSRPVSSDLLTEDDIAGLPEPVKKYIRYTGAVGKPKLFNVCIKASGQIRSDSDSKWMTFQSEQYNFFSDPQRLFYIRAKKMGIPAVGLHLYKDCSASMEIKLAGIFRIVDARGKEMNQAETVTIFNDMCFMAPASLIDPNITWTTLDDKHVKAGFTNKNIHIEAILTFDPEGKLVNFLSNDRYETKDGKTFNNYPWETPVTEYGEFNDMRLPSKADVIYKRPSGDFCYLRFHLQDIAYNLN